MIYRWSEKGHHKPYGKFKTSVRKLIKGKRKYKLRDIEKSERIPKAKFYFDDLHVEVKPSFNDSLRWGWQINLTVAVDFTLSNGYVSSYDSLHYLNPTEELNQYQLALMNVGTILTNYDSDKLVTAYGFGGIPNYSGTGTVSHWFNLNGQENPQCKHVHGLMEAYKFSLKNVQLDGPTYFSPCFKAFIGSVSQNLSSQIYHVFMILTDGDIHDIIISKFNIFPLYGWNKDIDSCIMKYANQYYYSTFVKILTFYMYHWGRPKFIWTYEWTGCWQKRSQG